MKLADYRTSDREAWAALGIETPRFDHERMRAQTLRAPCWIHFGAGNVFRSFIAVLSQALLDKGLTSSGVIVVDGYPEVVERIYRPSNNLSLAVTLGADGTIQKRLIASIAAAYVMDYQRSDWVRLRGIFRNPSLQIASFTITEQGYRVLDIDGRPLPPVRTDLKHGPANPVSYQGKIASLLYARFLAGALPISMLSMDNSSDNGDRLKSAVLLFAEHWSQNRLVKRGFAEYVCDGTKVGFPCSMIDKITPTPDKRIAAMLKAEGFDDTRIIVTAKGFRAAPFVNAEETQYLVVEDWFPAGRPPLAHAGVTFTDRETVDRAERMKVSACFNSLHTALALFGRLLGFECIYEEMRDADLCAFVRRLGYREGLPAVDDPGIIDPKAFLDEVIDRRLPNAFLPDTPRRIASDTSVKMYFRFGQTIQAYRARPELSTDDLVCIPTVIACWLRYLLGVDDLGRAFALSPDPMLRALKERFKDVCLGWQGDVHVLLAPLLSDAALFGANLYEDRLGERVERTFSDMIAKMGAVRGTLRARLAE